MLESLTSALSKLHARFRDDPQSLHFAISLVFSSILKKYRLPCIIVGGQAAAYWMRLPGSTDVDFVSPDSANVADILEKCGFEKGQDLSFRFCHPATNVLIELVGKRIDIAGIQTPATTEVQPKDVNDSVVRALMPGPADILDPIFVFINYVEASNRDSIWYEFEDEGALAIERAQALLALYKEYVVDGLIKLNKTGEISTTCLQLLRDKFMVTL
jgi:hypothetical protein